jgi:hypothetical protein
MKLNNHRDGFDARPLPGPLPRGAGGVFAAFGDNVAAGFTTKVFKDEAAGLLPPLLGERVGERASVTTNF